MSIQTDNRHRILVGLSGGVDSATTAWLLTQQHPQVEAVYMRNWHDEDGHCPSLEDQQDAQAVADHLGIPLHIVDFSEPYKRLVFEHMLKDLQQGLTPNPDILCNENIKFGCLLTWAQEHGYSHLATGHYARVVKHNGQYQLLAGLDPIKDQSYFLARMPQAALAYAQFPLGGMRKSEVRALAQQAELPVAQKKDSTGICFIGKRSFADFISQYLLDKPGPIISDNGDILGQHRGLFYHTIGQRKGLHIGGLKHHAEAPWYVIAKNLEQQSLIVSQNSQHPWLYSQNITLRDCQWLSPPQQQQHYHGRVRHGQSLQNCHITHISNHQQDVQLSFETAQRAAAYGQYGVLYDPNTQQCLGGGIITPPTAWS